MRVFAIDDFMNKPCQPEWDAYHNAKTDAERASVVLRNYAWVCDYSVATLDPTELVKECIAASANVDSEGSDGRTALMWASAKGHFKCVRLLIEAGAT